MNGTPASDPATRLHDYFRSSAAYRVRIALNLKGVPYERVFVDLRTGAQTDADYKTLNPQAMVPLLEMDGLRLTQSLAIIDYLEARFPEPPLTSPDPAVRSRQLAMALLIACDIHPLNNLRVLKYLKRELRIDEPEREAWYRHWVEEGFVALERMAAGQAGTFLCGDRPGIADICLVPQMYNARRMQVALDDFATLRRIDTTLAKLPAFVEAHPDKVAPTA